MTRPRKHSVTCSVCGETEHSNYATEVLHKYHIHMQEEHAS
jgi:hypothetical protein